ncbi:MAG TPA: acyltransferase [Herbaspirillum sp.]|jgi:peptidoglycan/LPS O-acetylase OafA/YrhL
MQVENASGSALPMTPEKQTGSAGADHRHRLNFLDGLRGIAIFLVLLFHSYARWPELVPFGDRFVHVPIFYYGWLGVDLFFLISGFVIFMTLEKCENFRDFISRRWLRLFPAMLICSLLVFASVGLFPERPSGAVIWRDMLPGLTFIEPTWWGLVLGSPQGLIEGAFWSLFVEVKFYFIAGLLYFFIGGKRMIVVLTGLFACAAAVSKMQHVFPHAAALHWPNLLLQAASAGQFGWFAGGALFYRYFHERKTFLFNGAVLVSIAAAIAIGGLRPQQTIAALLVVLVFTAAVSIPLMQSVLSRRLLIFLGFISYPLYLLHENMLVAMIVKMGRAAPWMPSILMPLLPIAAVICAGSLIAVYIEPWLRGMLKPVYKKMRFFIGVAAPA